MLRPAPAVLSVVALVALSSASDADEVCRPRLTLALSGGGARGIAHVGVLKALDENGIHVDGIAGTSVGALVGSLYASGYEVERLEGIIDSLDWQSLFIGRSDRRLLPVSRRRDDALPIVSLGFDLWKVRLPAAALAEYPVNRFLIQYLSGPSFAAEGDFDRLKIPFRAVATGLDNGERMVLSNGSLPRAVRGSISFPVAFPPIDYQGRILVDGGLVDNLPTAAARALGGDVVVAVDIQSLPLEPSRWGDLVGVAGQVSNILGGISNNVYHEEPDVLIKPDLGRHSFNDYSGFHELIAKGYEATLAALPEIRRRLEEASVAERPAPREVPKVPDLKGRLIREIKVTGNDKYPEKLIRRSFNVPLGVPFDLDKALLALDKVNATGFFDHCWLDAEALGEDGLRLLLRVKESPANRLELGGSFSDANKAKATFRLRNRNLFGFGEELDLGFAASSGGVGAGVALQGDQIFTPVLGYEGSVYSYSERPRFFVDGEYLNRARFQRDGARLVLRHGVKRLALFDGGFVFGRVKTEPRLGLDFAQANDAVRLLTGGINYDVLDDSLYPETGQRLQLRGDKSPSGLGASRDYWRASLSARLARPLGKRGVIEIDAFGGLSGGDLPVYEQFRLGGPILLPGWYDGELWGGQAFSGALSYRHRLIRQLRVLARVGAGNVWEQRGDVRIGSVKPGAGLGLYQPTRVGPVALELGIREGGKALVTLSVGNP